MFHVVFDASRTTGAALAVQERRAAEALKEAEHARKLARAEADTTDTSPRGPGRSIAWDHRLAAAEWEVADAREVLDEARTQREAMQQDVRSVARAYHPFDLATGAVRSVRVVGAARDRRADGGACTRGGAGRAQRGVAGEGGASDPAAGCAIAWVHRQIGARVSELSQPPAVMGELIPGLYLLRAAGRAFDSETIEGLRTRGQELVSRALPDAIARLKAALG